MGASSSMSRSKTAASPPAAPEGEELYRREYASVRPLAPGPARVPVVPRGGRSPDPAAGRARESASPPAFHLERSGERILAMAPSISRETVRALSQGERPVEATCDLHGLRADAAHARLVRFIEDSVHRGRRRVLIVCGRGQHSGGQGPVLRELAVAVLAGPAVGRHVLAFASAPPGQGGEGALAVLLRRRRTSRG